jgi:phosphoglycerol transferase
MWLATYYTVPLMMLVVFWVWDGEPLFTFGGEGKSFRFRATGKGITALLIAALVASTGIYYALFGVFLIAVGSVLRHRNWRLMVPGAVVVGVIALFIVLNMVPNMVYTSEHGKNTEVPNRYPAQTEYFALRIIQMLLPVMHHRVEGLAKFASNYYTSAPLINENATATLGLVASAGFLILLAWQIGLRWSSSRERLLTNLSVMNLCCVLLGTMGGFCSVLAFGVSPAIRCFNRLSIFIAFFAVFMVLLALEKLRERWGKSTEGKTLWTIGVVAMLGLGLADQTTEFFVPPYSQSAASFRSDGDFVRAIEAKLPADSMVFQLPYLPFPEGPPGEMAMLRAYLHSRTLRWSYGAMTGRETDKWFKQKVLADGNLQTIVQKLTEAGFKGIFVDRQMLQDAQRLEGALKQAVDPSPLESADRRFSFYSLVKNTAPQGR